MTLIYSLTVYSTFTQVDKSPYATATIQILKSPYATIQCVLRQGFGSGILG